MSSGCLFHLLLYRAHGRISLLECKIRVPIVDVCYFFYSLKVPLRLQTGCKGAQLRVTIFSRSCRFGRWSHHALIPMVFFFLLGRTETGQTCNPMTHPLSTDFPSVQLQGGCGWIVRQVVRNYHQIIHLRAITRQSAVFRWTILQTDPLLMRRE